MHKRKEIVQDVTLHDLDSANARPQVRWRGGGWGQGRHTGAKTIASDAP